MRIVVVSDIHGNALALEAVHKDLHGEQFDLAVCLGDAVQGGAQPAEAVALLRETGWPVVMGNADYWLVTGDDSGETDTTEWMKAVRDWSLSHLSVDDIKFIHVFVPTVDLSLPGGRILRCAHGTPNSIHELILLETSDEEAHRLLRVEDGVLYCGGHTHAQQLRRLDQSLFFNPGSVALPFVRDGRAGVQNVYGWAVYAMVTAEEDGRFAVEFRQIPYDVHRVVETILSSGMPEPERLARRYPGGSDRID